MFQTGTLTEDGLDFYGVIPSRSGEKFGGRVEVVTALPTTSPLVQALASCHSLTSIQGELKGDPLDLKMFEFTRWVSFTYTNISHYNHSVKHSVVQRLLYVSENNALV